MSVAGLDFGNLSLLIALTRAGGVDVILNSASNRQTATAVSVQGRQRFIGDEGAAMVRGFRALSYFDGSSRWRFHEAIGSTFEHYLLSRCMLAQGSLLIVLVSLAERKQFRAAAIVTMYRRGLS
jgi:hypothetical protein